MLKGKTVVLGITGGIAAYKMATLASMLKKLQADVVVIMTRNATNFITPMTFESLTGNKCLVDTFDRNFQFQVEHIALAKRADVFLIAPATANVIAKVACGLADDMLTTTFLATKAPKLIAPAMNTNMYENPIVQDNIKRCISYGMKMINPTVGYLACGDTGAGKMAEAEVMLEQILLTIAYEKDLVGKRVLVTAGPTRESFDPVRFMTNHSTGKMGYEIAKAAARRGAEVTLISGMVSLTPPIGVSFISVRTAEEMFQAVKECANNQDIIIKSAAVADYRPKQVREEKTKKSEGTFMVELERTIDILAWLGEHRREGQFLCGFSMETEDLIENSKKKLKKKNVDMIVANHLKTKGAGFGVDTNVVTLIQKDQEKELPLMTKEQVAHQIINEILQA